jgi:hypothetical protein
MASFSDEEEHGLHLDDSMAEEKHDLNMSELFVSVLATFTQVH